MGELFRWITLFNFGDGVAPPTLEFFQHENGRKRSRRGLRHRTQSRRTAQPQKALLNELGMPEATDDADALLPDAKPTTDAPAGAPAPAGQARPAEQAGAQPDTNPNRRDQASGQPKGAAFARLQGLRRLRPLHVQPG